MERHADRIRRIQELCAQLSSLIEESQRIQQTVRDLHLESKALLDDLDVDIAPDAGAAPWTPEPS